MPRNYISVIGVYESMTCACALVAYLGLRLPLLDGVPRTIQFESVDWISESPTQTYSFSGVIATSSDGSRANWVQYTNRTFHLFVKDKSIAHLIYIRTPPATCLVSDFR